MKKRFAFLLTCLAALSSCGNPQTPSDVSSLSSQETFAPAEIYLDTATKRANNFKISSTKITSEKKNDQYNFELTIELYNDSGSNIPLNIKDCRITREETGEYLSVPINNNTIPGAAEYYESVTGTQFKYPSSYTLKTSGTLPTDIKQDQYNISFTLNTREVIYHLYDTPEDKRPFWMVTYKVDQKTVHQEEIRDKDTIKNEYKYDSPDHQKYCSRWYEDTSYKTLFNRGTQIRSNINIYGYTSSNWEFNSLDNPGYQTITMMLHIPGDKIVVVPSSKDNKEIIIADDAFYFVDAIIDKIYIPYGVHSIGSNNFSFKRKPTICYEGNEEQWKSLFNNENDIVTTNVVYNTKSPF